MNTINNDLIKLFDDKLNILITLLLNDKKIIVNNKVNVKLNKPSSLYRLKINIDNIINNYEVANELFKLCASKDEFKYCICNKDNPYKHVCIICNTKLVFNGHCYNVTCRNKQCLCKILLSNTDISDKHQYIKTNYLNGDLEFSPIQIGFIEKYGVYNNSQLNTWKTKQKTTWQNKTAEELAERRNRTIQTCRKKYGCDFSQQNTIIKAKQKTTWQNKTTEELEDKENKRKATCLERYGVDHVMHVPSIIDNHRKLTFEKYGYNHWVQKDVHNKDIYCNDNSLIEFVKEKYVQNDNKKIKKSYFDEFFNINVMYRFNQLDLLKYIKISESKLENKFKSLFDDNNIEYNWRNRSIIDGINGDKHKYELDFYIPDYNIGIEINDLSSHNILSRSLKNNIHGKNYHLYKTLNCKEKGIRLIHLWEWEIHNNTDKIYKWLLNELSDTKIRIFARKCIIKLVDVNTERQFLNDYHLQGYTKSTIALGLYYNDDLIQIMTFNKPRFSNKYEYELIRLCSKYNYVVVGGAKRLFNNFIHKYNPSSIISYCDAAKFSGIVYENIGMKFIKHTAPMIWYCNYDWNVINESILMKYGIDNLLGTKYGKNTDNRELILKEGYLPVYNCGNLIYEWKNNKYN